MILGDVVMALYPFGHLVSAQPTVDEFAAHLEHLPAAGVLRPLAGGEGQDPALRTENLALLAASLHSRALSLMTIREALDVGRTILGVLIAWLTHPGTSSHRRNTGVFQLVSFHMCVNGMLCAVLEPKRHLRVLARAAHPALQDLIL